VSVAVIHAIPGRMRLRISSLKGNDDLARPLRERLSSIPGVAHVEVNPVTGSVLVVHHGQEPNAPELVHSLAQGLSPIVGMDTQRLQAYLTHDARQRGSRPFLHRESVHGFFSELNASVRSATGGVELNLLVPALLLLLGIRRLLVDGGLHSPRWYDFMWFGFATYLMLNNPAVTKELEPVVESGLKNR
jgi:hypothetical protein